MGDLVFIGSLFFAAATPIAWIILLILLRKSLRARVVAWLSFVGYLLIALAFFIMLANASGWDGLGYLFIGCFAISIYTVLALIILLILRKKLNATKIIREEQA